MKSDLEASKLVAAFAWRVVLPRTMVDKLTVWEENIFSKPDITGDTFAALVQLRGNLSSRSLSSEDYPFDDFNVESYLPFMNYLQNLHYDSVRRFVLVHSQAVNAVQWEVEGNGV